jgi:glutathione S-transferase
MLELYHHGSPVYAAKVRMVLAEKDMAWTGHYIDLLKGEQFAPDYLKLNPKALVPTLVDGGSIIGESTVICEYLDHIHSGTPLRPAKAVETARMRNWTKFIDEFVHPMCAA